jgi:PAS domain S-box-containing protein
MPKKAAEEILEQRIAALEKENAELRQGYKKYWQLLENLNEVLFTLDTTGSVTFITQNIQEIAGYRADEIIGHNFVEFVHPEHLQGRMENFRKILSGENLVTEYKFLTKHNESVWTRANARPIVEHEEIIGIQGILVDITEQKQSEAALRKSEQKFRDFFDNSADAIFVHHVDGQILEVNEVACKQTGYSREELLRMTPRDLVIPDEAPKVDQRIQASSQKGRLIFETTHRRKDGIEYPVEVKTRRIEYNEEPCILGVARDITERKIREDILRESEYQKNLILNSALEKIIYFDTGFRIIWANRAAAAIVDKTEEEMAGRHCYEVFHQRSKPCPGCIVKKAIDTKSPQQAEKTGAGERTWFQRAYPAIEDSGEVNAVVMFAQDITEKKQAEAEKAQLELQFQQAQKLESIGRLAGGVAHDLNNLLSPILGYGEMLLASADKGSQQKKQIDHIMDAGKRAQAMIRQLLAFSRKQILEFTPIDLNDLLRNFQNLLSYTLRESISIHMSLAEGLPDIRGDGGQIEQVLMNLAVNAQDAMQGKGRFFIETAAVELDGNYAKTKKGVTPGSYVRLTISDTGSGIDLEKIDQVFEPFFTTKEKEKGTGLGLSTAYGIVKQHGGNIWAYSEPGLGTTFKIYFPAVPREASQPPEPAAKAEAPSQPAGEATILVAEDEEVVRDLVISMLEMQGYHVLSGKNGAEALSIVNKHGGAVDLLLTDVIMPDMSGKDLYGQVSRRNPGLKSIFMSGYTENVIAYQGVLDPGVNFLQKPFSIEDLKAKIEEVLGQ